MFADDSSGVGTCQAVTAAGADLRLTDDAIGLAPSTTAISADVAGDAGYRYRLTVTNDGPSAFSGGFIVTDLLPVDALFQPTQSTAGCMPNATNPREVSCSSAAGLAVNASEDFFITVNVRSQHFQAAPFVEPLYSDSASLSVATGSTPEPSGAAALANNSESAAITLRAEADLELSDDSVALTPPETPFTRDVAGDPGYRYKLTVENLGPSSFVGSFTVRDTLPVDAVFQTANSSPACAPTTANPRIVECTSSAGLTAPPSATSSAVFFIAVNVLSSHFATAPFVDVHYADSAGLLFGPDSVPEPANQTGTNTDDAPITLVAEADLHAISLVHLTPFTDDVTQADQVYATRTLNVTPANTLRYTFKFTNDGPSDARGVTLTLSLPHVSRAQSLKAIDYGFCQGTCSVDSFPLTASGDVVTVGSVPAKADVTVVVRVRTDPDSRNGKFSNINVTGRLTAATPQGADSAADVAPDTAAAGIEIDTVPGPPTANLATAGNGQAGLSWTAPGNNGGKPINSYTVYACTGSIVPPACVIHSGPRPASDLSYIIGPLSNGTPYTLYVTATNDVGESEASNGLAVTPTSSADTKEIVSNTATVDTGLGGGAVGCTSPADPNCKNIVSTYTVTSPNNNGALVNVDAEKRVAGGGSSGGTASLGAMALIATAAAEPAFECIEVDVNSGNVERDPAHCVKGDKIVRSTFPLTVGNKLHLETDQYDRTITTDAAGVACLKLETAADGTLPRSTRGTKPVILECELPDYPKLFVDGNGNKTNICPEGTGWKPTKPCAYIYYESMLVPGFDITCAGSGTALCRPKVCASTLSPAPCNLTTAIGSSVAAGIRIHPVSPAGVVSRTVAQIVRPWCIGIFPFFVSTPCVRSYQTLVTLPTNPNLLDTRVLTYVNDDILKSGGTG
jgi:hypothetical protein